MDSWIYPAAYRLHSLGHLNTAYLGLQPWTWQGIAQMIDQAEYKRDSDADDTAFEITAALRRQLMRECPQSLGTDHVKRGGIESVYNEARAIVGTPLHDSYHFGQSFRNDYGRPYEKGFNDYTGISFKAEQGLMALYVRGEYQRAPSAMGYPFQIAAKLSSQDAVPAVTVAQRATVPLGPIPSTNAVRLLEGYVSSRLFGYEVSIGKNDYWLGPGNGGALLWSTNAEPIYAFQINRAEPVWIPGLSKITGPFRYEFLVGSLKGHTDPNAPWIHTEKVSFKPTRNLEFGFARSVIWGGKSHEPVSVDTFLHSFFSLANVTYQVKNSNRDPGDRLGQFDFDYRVPLLRNWLTIYADNAAHDDVSPVSAPRRASYRTGLYLPQCPGLHSVDLRIEAANTDPPTSRSNRGQFLYWEAIQRQGYTNKGFLIGDSIGREDKGGQAWLTYHLSPLESVQLSYSTAKAAKDFIPGGTTQNAGSIEVVKRLGTEVEVRGSVQFERYSVPLLAKGAQSDTSAVLRITWYPDILSVPRRR